MGSPAARLGDPTVHGGVLLSGFPQVMIGNQPAARVTDLHACPMVTALVPHVGGPLIVGSATVMVGNQPQSRMGDALTCIGPPDAVAMGCPTVVVGMAGGGAGAAGLTMGIILGAVQVLVKETAGSLEDAASEIKDVAKKAKDLL